MHDPSTELDASSKHLFKLILMYDPSTVQTTVSTHCWKRLAEELRQPPLPIKHYCLPKGEGDLNRYAVYMYMSGTGAQEGHNLLPTSILKLGDSQTKN